MCKCTKFDHCTSSQHVELNKLSAFEHPVENCWAALSLVESNVKLVKLFAQHGSIFPLFRGHPCVAQQRLLHLHSNAQNVEPTHAQYPAYPKILSHDSTWALVKTSECSTCWVIVEAIWRPCSIASQQTQQVESLYSGQIQCICTLLKLLNCT